MARARCIRPLVLVALTYAACSPDAGLPMAADAGAVDGDASPDGGDAGDAPDVSALLRLERADSGMLVLEARAEVARSEDERRRGLRDHPPLAPGEALLIELPLELDDICVVNDGVSFDIDGVFVRADGTVVTIERAIPAGETTARCHDRTRWIVEIAAGQARDVLPGDRLYVNVPADP
jgi:uncharacterized membrane protein (UPF0127 family)